MGSPCRLQSTLQFSASPQSMQTQRACLVPGLAASSSAVWPLSNCASFEEGRGKIKLSKERSLHVGQ